MVTTLWRRFKKPKHLIKAIESLWLNRPVWMQKRPDSGNRTVVHPDTVTHIWMLVIRRLACDFDACHMFLVCAALKGHL